MDQENNRCYIFSDFSLEVREHCLKKGGQEIYLRPKAFEILLFMVKRGGRLVKKSELLDEVWKDTFVTENVLSQCIKEIRHALKDDSAQPRFIKTIPRMGFKFIAPVTETVKEISDPHAIEPDRILDDPGMLSSKQEPFSLQREKRQFFPARKTTGVLLIVLALVFTAAYFILKPNSAVSFAARDWVLVTDFENYTGEDIFATALRTALEHELSRSVYVNVVPPSRVLDALQFMQRDPATTIDEQTGREICLRDGGIRAMLSGSIEEMGGHYVITMKLINPVSDVTITSFSREANSREEVLPAVSHLAVELRKKLGESLDAISMTNRVLEHATTPSLEALQIYSKGVYYLNLFDWERARVFFEQAIQHDSTFAMSYLYLGFAYLWTGQLPESRTAFAKAVQLSENATDREKYFILGSNAAFSLGDFQQAIANYEVLVELYPDDYWGHENLSQIYLWAGDYQRCVEQKQICARIRPYYAINYSDLGVDALFLEQDVTKAHTEFSHALQLNPDIPMELPYLSAAFLDWMNGDLDSARSKMEAFIAKRQHKLLPYFQTTSRWFLARFFLFNGQQDRALQLLQTSAKQAVQLPNSNLTTWNRIELALTFLELGDSTKFERLLRTAPNETLGIARVKALGWLAIYFANSGDTDQAKQFLQQLMAEDRQMPYGIIQPHLPMELDRAKEAFSILIHGKIAFIKGNTGQAIKDFRQVIELVPSAQKPAMTALSPRIRLVAYRSLAHVYEQQQNWDAAIAAYQAILDDKALVITVPAASSIWVKTLYSISYVFGKKGEIEKANFYKKQYGGLWPEKSIN